MADIVIEPSGMAPLRVVREVELLAPKAAAAVEGHFGIALPPVSVVVAGRVGLATALLMANGWRRARLRHVAAFWRHQYRQAAFAYAFTTVTQSERILIGVNATDLKCRLAEVWPTLVHELVHAIQHDRPGRREELRAGVDHDLRIAEMPPDLRRAMDAVVAVEEAEAYLVERFLDPNAPVAEPFDVAAMASRIEGCAKHWAVAALSHQSI